MEKRIELDCADVIDYPCDVLVLKYAQAYYGADGDVVRRFGAKQADIAPLPDEYVLLPSKREIAAKQVLFVGVDSLGSFGYAAIRMFAARSMEILASQAPDAVHVAMTMHGVGYGLDEREAFLAQVGGLIDSFREGSAPASLELVTIVERSAGRARRLKAILDGQAESEPAPGAGIAAISEADIAEIDAGPASDRKPHVFVAMPFTEEMEDVFGFGIQGPVNQAGYLCERVDITAYTGDIVRQIRSRIETASLVIADLTGANPNVYLEVGYAWGRNKPTLLVTRRLEELQFDVRGQRCIIYRNISDLAAKLKRDLDELLG